jgi:hypothetical protein
MQGYMDLKFINSGFDKTTTGKQKSSPPPEKCDRHVFMEGRKLSTLQLS